MNLAHGLLATAEHQPDAVAWWWRDDPTTYGELADRALRLATGLRSLGVEPGERVALACANNPYFVVTYLAALAAGAVAVPVNPMAPAEELAREASGTGARLVVAGPAGTRPVREAVDHGLIPGATVVLGGRPSSEDPPVPGAARWEDLTGQDPGTVEPRQPGDPAVLAHTSGTSGAPRAAILTHGSLGANLGQAQRHPTMRVERGDVVLAVLPLFHSYGLNAVLGLGLSAGVELVLAERFDPHDTLELVRRRGVTVIPGVPPMFSAWLALPGVEDAFSTVRVAVSGAAPLPIEVQRAFRERFGVALHQGYGLTEASPIVTTTGGGDDPRPGSIGVPLPGVEVRLVDAQGGETLVGDPGEIWVRGDNVFAGYWGDAEATARVLTEDGWLKTGDVAVADADGFLSIVDRSKDLVIVSGFNVYPTEVEEVLVRHEGVAEAAVVGVPHPHSGEAVKAFVVPAPGADLDEHELVEFVGRSLARYKCPAAIEVVDALPKGLAGKVIRRRLADLGLADPTGDAATRQHPE